MNRARGLSDALVSESEPGTKEYSVIDSGLLGFGLRVQPSGAKSWVLRVRRGGVPKRITLGDARVMSCAVARTAAHGLMAGEQGSPSQPASRLSFRRFELLYRQRRSSAWKPSTLRTYDSYMRATLMPTFGQQLLASITHADVVRWFHDYGRTKPGGANRALDILKDMLARGREWELLPTAGRLSSDGIVPHRRPPRGRVLNAEALERLGAALQEFDAFDRDVADAVRLILLTGCRPGEILGLRWTAVHRDRLMLPDSKTGPRAVMLGTVASRLLAKCSRRASTPFVFPHRYDATRPRLDISSTWQRIARQAQLPTGTRLHDLRHTHASMAIMGGESMFITAALLGHRRLETTARYAHLQDRFLLAAAARIAERINELSAPRRQRCRTPR